MAKLYISETSHQCTISACGAIKSNNNNCKCRKALDVVSWTEINIMFVVLQVELDEGSSRRPGLSCRVSGYG